MISPFYFEKHRFDSILQYNYVGDVKTFTVFCQKKYDYSVFPSKNYNLIVFHCKMTHTVMLTIYFDCFSP